ncbi:MAG: GAF domain-containing protein [Verrucomicrobia bacterium]|nr:GAF domain-containing protein [Verrucomicrobiota bacterium]
MNAPRPINESGRLAALREYYILDSSAEQAFEEIAGLAAFICDVPIAMISFVDEARQWFKARIGISEQETPRDIAFCAHTILRTDPLIVDDACADLRFASNPLVTEEPRIRFYAGFPLITRDGFALGALCAADRKPRHITDRQQNAMRFLARQIISMLELRRLSARLADALESTAGPSGLSLICLLCRKIRDQTGHWLPSQDFFRQHFNVKLSPAVCDDCFAGEVGKLQ